MIKFSPEENQVYPDPLDKYTVKQYLFWSLSGWWDFFTKLCIKNN